MSPEDAALEQPRAAIAAGSLDLGSLAEAQPAPGTKPGRESGPAESSIQAGEVVGAARRRQELLQLLAHDARNGILAMQRSLELLLQGIAGALTEAQAGILRDTRESGDLLLGMTDDILDISSFEAGEVTLRPSVFNLSDSIGRSVRLCRSLGADRGVSVEVEAGGAKRTVVVGDRRRIERVLVNLLVNALRFSPAGGAVRVASARHAGRVVVGVEDSGPGIPAAQRTRVFEKYFRGAGSESVARPGLGLGLYFCQQTVRAHGGEIWIESPVGGSGRGTRVSFTLTGAGPVGKA